MWVVHKGRERWYFWRNEVLKVKTAVGEVRWMKQGIGRKNILAFCLCLIRINKPFQLSSRVKEMHAWTGSCALSGHVEPEFVTNSTFWLI